MFTESTSLQTPATSKNSVSLYLDGEVMPKLHTIPSAGLPMLEMTGISRTGLTMMLINGLNGFKLLDLIPYWLSLRMTQLNFASKCEFDFVP